jgi:hypothetical protein
MLAATEADDDDDDDESGEDDASDGGGDDASSGSDAAPTQRAATQHAAVPRSAPAPRSASRALTDAAKARIKAIPTVCGPSLNQLSLLPCTGSIRQSRIVRETESEECLVRVRVPSQVSALSSTGLDSNTRKAIPPYRPLHVSSTLALRKPRRR